MRVRLAITAIIETFAMSSLKQDRKRGWAMGEITRRDWLKGASAAWAIAQANWSGAPALALASELPHARPPRGERHFSSAAVEALIPRVQRGVGDRALATIFENCFPNTLDT